MASLLPPGRQQFFDWDGTPLSNGTVGFYTPGTTTPQTTWQDAAATMPNTNPVQLDSTGSAVIYGAGSYRSILSDQYGNQIWDANTSEPGANLPGDQSIGGNLTVTGNCSAAAFITTSDARLKEDVRPVYLHDAVRFVRSVPAVAYSVGGSEEVGFVAQDVEAAHFPEMVGHVPDQRIGVALALRYNHATAYHQAVIGFLLEEVAELKRRVAALRG